MRRENNRYYKLKRKDFYKEYIRITDRRYTDKMVFTKSQREDARRRGKLKISKTERRVFMLLGYLMITVYLCALYFAPALWRLLPFGVLYFVLHTFITDFSIIGTEILYSIYRRDSVYCSLLYDVFRGEADAFFEDVRRKTKKFVNGYVRIKGGRVFAEYITAGKRREERISVILSPKRVKVKVSGQVFVIDDVSLTRDTLLDEIARIVTSVTL